MRVNPIWSPDYLKVETFLPLATERWSGWVSNAEERWGRKPETNSAYKCLQTEERSQGCQQPLEAENNSWPAAKKE